MSVTELVWCGQVIEASCRTTFIPFLTGMQRVSVYTNYSMSACTVHTYTHTHIYVWALYVLGGVVTVDCRMRVAGRDSLLVLFIGAHQTHASTWQNGWNDLRAPQRSCIQHTVKTTGSSPFTLKSRGRQWAPLVPHRRKYFSTCDRGSLKNCLSSKRVTKVKVTIMLTYRCTWRNKNWSPHCVNGIVFTSVLLFLIIILDYHLWGIMMYVVFNYCCSWKFLDWSWCIEKHNIRILKFSLSIS